MYIEIDLRWSRMLSFNNTRSVIYIINRAMSCLCVCWRHKDMIKDTRSVCHSRTVSLRGDTWSACHLTSEKIPGLSVTSKTLGRCTPSSASRIQIPQGCCSPWAPHISFFGQTGMEGWWIKTKFRWKARIQIRGCCTPRTPTLPQPPASLFRSNRYGVLYYEKPNLDSGCCTPLEKISGLSVT